MMMMTLHPFGTRERHRSRARNFTVLFIVFLSTISDFFELIDYRSDGSFILCFVFLFFLVNDSMRVLPSFPDRWLIRRGTPSLPRSEAQRLLPWRRHLRTELLLLYTSTDLGASKEVLPQSSPAFSNTRSSSYDRTFFHPEMHGSMIFHPLRMRSTTRGRVREIEWGVC